jgi:hypothetical protein
MDTYRAMICDEVIHLSKEEKIFILKILKRHDSGKVKKFPDGTRIILNKVPDDVIKSIYDFVKRRLNLPENES